MLQWISDWLREIILIILLAVFIDLLLPSNAMQRYVKVVLSLFILMTILSPLVTLLKSDLNFNRWEDEATDVGSIQSLDEVLAVGEGIRKNNELKTMHIIEAQLATQMKRELELALPGQIHSVTVEVEADGDQVGIKVVQVVAAPYIEQSNDSEWQNRAALPEEELFYIEPVQSVVINIEIDHINEEHVFSNRGDQTASMQSERHSQISYILEQNWHVSSKQLVITFMEDISSLFDQEVSLWASFYRSWRSG